MIFWAIAIIGGIPTPPPMRRGILRSVSSKPFPMGPITDSTSPIFLSASCSFIGFWNVGHEKANFSHVC